MNPFGDLEAIAQIHCLLKPGGVLFLGLPMGYDTVVWNAHRVYGKYRLAVILAFGWEIIDLIGNTKDISDHKNMGEWYNQPIWILKKI